MKKVILLLGLILLLVGCSTAANGGFAVDEETFKETYEEQADRNFPTNITYYPEDMMRIEKASTSEIIPFLETADHFLGGDGIRRLIKSIENEENNIPDTITTDGYMINTLGEEDNYIVSIVPYEEE